MKNDPVLLIVGHRDCTEAELFAHFSLAGDRVVSSARVGLNVQDRAAVDAFFDSCPVQRVILTSVRSGGIGANQARPAEFMYENLQAQNNVIDASFRHGVKKLLYLAASCVYPRDCAQPMKEEDLFSGPMEKTSEPYSLAKAAGMVLCQAYRRQYGFNAIVAIPATVYGPGGDGQEESHVLEALVSRVRQAVREGLPEITLWGSGSPRREFVHADDLASACAFLLESYNEDAPVNIGAGEDISIRELAGVVAGSAGYNGRICWDTSRPDGAPRKLLDSSRLKALGWRPGISLAQGVSALFTQDPE